VLSSPLRLALIGLRGCGKSTVGRAVADRLGLPFHDSDEQVTEISGLTPDRLISEMGEGEFREWERRAVSQLATLPAVVLSLGGGAPMQESVREALAGFTVVLLDADDHVLAARIESDRVEGRAQRPALTDLPLAEEIAELRRHRFTVYRSFATLIVDTSLRTPERIVDYVLSTVDPPFGATQDE